jgi:hypothetical protein
VVRFTPRLLYPQERAPGTHWIGGWVGPRAGLDAVVKRKIPSPYRDSNNRSSSPRPNATPTELSRLLSICFACLHLFFPFYHLTSLLHSFFPSSSNFLHFFIAPFLVSYFPFLFSCHPYLCRDFFSFLPCFYFLFTLLIRSFFFFSSSSVSTFPYACLPFIQFANRLFLNK